MSLFDHFCKSLRLQGKACKFLFSNKMAWTLFAPVAIFIIMTVVGIWSIGELATYCAENLIADDFIISTTVITIIIQVLFFVVFSIWGGYIVVIIMSPFLAYVSEKTEKILTGNDVPFDMIQFVKDVFRGIILAIRNFFMEIVLQILVFLCAFVPLLGPLFSLGCGAILLFCISAYYYGFSFMDYTNERRKLTVHQSVNLVKGNKGMAIGHGFLFALILYIPFVGPFFSAFMAIVSTVAATMEMNETDIETQSMV